MTMNAFRKQCHSFLLLGVRSISLCRLFVFPSRFQEFPTHVVQHPYGWIMQENFKRLKRFVFKNIRMRVYKASIKFYKWIGNLLFTTENVALNLNDSLVRQTFVVKFRLLKNFE